ncbi:hypothetical protein K3495_g16296 [Podosphaera aphanis]|nr:hypothetical protein K3495_g16296 [Podosphaera aphanis]
MPDGRPSRGSDKEYYSSENPAPTVQPTNYKNLTTNSDRPMMRNEPKFEVDLDGDTQMLDINSLQSQLQSHTESILAVLKGGDVGASINRRKNESRPFPPDVPRGERNRRIDSNRCERCNKSPSHRWSDCKFRNFRDNPTPRGYSSSRRVAVNSVAKQPSETDLISDSEN